jgi:hypothetical protein
LHRSANWSGWEFGRFGFKTFSFLFSKFSQTVLFCFLLFFLAGFLAREMGFPIKLVATVNSNDILARTFQNGDYSPAPDVAASLAPAMDIQVIPY